MIFTKIKQQFLIKSLMYHILSLLELNSSKGNIYELRLESDNCISGDESWRITSVSEQFVDGNGYYIDINFLSSDEKEFSQRIYSNEKLLAQSNRVFSKIYLM